MVQPKALRQIIGECWASILSFRFLHPAAEVLTTTFSNAIRPDQKMKHPLLSRKFCAHAIGLALLFSATGVSAQTKNAYPQKFDLICHGTAFTAFRPYPHTRGTGLAYPLKPWPDDDYFIVDLTAQKFCGGRKCSQRAPGPLKKVEWDRIFFDDEIGFHTSVDLETRKYVRQIEGDEGEIQAARDTCRFAPFSGFH